MRDVKAAIVRRLARDDRAHQHPINGPLHQKALAYFKLLG